MASPRRWIDGVVAVCPPLSIQRRDATESQLVANWVLRRICDLLIAEHHAISSMPRPRAHRQHADQMLSTSDRRTARGYRNPRRPSTGPARSPSAATGRTRRSPAALRRGSSRTSHRDDEHPAEAGKVLILPTWHQSAGSRMCRATGHKGKSRCRTRAPGPGRRRRFRNAVARASIVQHEAHTPPDMLTRLPTRSRDRTLPNSPARPLAM